MITPSTSSGDNHDGQPGHAVIAARLRSELNDKTKLMVAINTVSHTDAVRLRITRRKVRSASSCASSRPPGGRHRRPRLRMELTTAGWLPRFDRTADCARLEVTVARDHCAIAAGFNGRHLGISPSAPLSW